MTARRPGKLSSFWRRVENRDPRIRLCRSEKNRGISFASNLGLEAARGEWIALLDHDDLLEPDALFQTAKLLSEHPDADLIYSDEDKLTEAGFDSPFFKPDWSPDLFLSHNYLCHFTTIRLSLVREVGGFRARLRLRPGLRSFSPDHDAVATDSPCARILYHWRRSAGSTAISIRAKPEALEAARRGLIEHLARLHQPGHVAD
jgi:glycosyltransferase involved in cell wall biosynthesis